MEPRSTGDLSEPARRDDHEGDGATRGTSRMEAFADGVFAIAFTLPIFNIVLPTVGPNPEPLSRELLAIWPHYLSYLLASVIIGLYWVHHHFSGAIYRTTGHWFLIATAIFLTMIGFIAFPARVFAEHLIVPAEREAASRYIVLALAAVSLSWLLKWSVGLRRGHVDQRLEPDYVRRLNRRYQRICAWKLAAAVVCIFSWELGLGMAMAGLAVMILPPETPRYQTVAPAVEGEEG
ncbi:MAG: TMEM175 family protein [Sphingomicrobium sp.]